MAARQRRKNDLVIEEQKTFLELLLERVAKGVSDYSFLAFGICIITHALFLVLLVVFNGDMDLWSSQTLLRIAKIGIIAVVILIVSIPEGLPLAVSIAMAMSVDSLKKDRIIIKKLESIQTCAMLHDVCVGKTGTLTEAKVQVQSYQIANERRAIENDTDNYPTFFNTELEIDDQLRQILKEAIISNTDVRIETDNENCKYKPAGQAIEVGLIQFLMDNGEDIQNIFINRNRYAPKVVQLPFDQNLKRKVVVRQVQGSEDLVRVYVKGAPEYVVPHCVKTLNRQVKPVDFPKNPDKRNPAANHADTLELVNNMAQQGQKVLSFAFKEIELSELQALSQHCHVESAKFRKALEVDLIYLGTFGLADPIRTNVKAAIHTIRYGHIKAKPDPDRPNAEVNVRMVTGDHLETAKYIAKQAGIVKEEELVRNGQPRDGVAMNGEDFRKAIGRYTKVWDPERDEYRIEFADQSLFDSVKRRLKIVARATAEDRFILVTGIKQKGGLVAMTGDSIADAEALKKADVGLCMGSGCDVAKENAALIIDDNNFESVHKAIKWGRAIFDNVRKFLQFQMTMNISLCFITILGGLTLGRPPLNIVQMLWCNLIMDVLGAIALGTEPYATDPNHE